MNNYNNISRDYFTSKVYNKMMNNYYESLKPHTMLINREYRPQQYAFDIGLNNAIRRQINKDLESLNSDVVVEDFYVKFTYWNIVGIVILIFIMLYIVCMEN